MANELDDKDLNKRKNKILDEAKKEVTKIAEDMTKHLELMGKNLAEANAKVWKKGA